MNPLNPINGIKPKVILEDGQECQMSSRTTDIIWVVKRISMYYTCTCPGWIYQRNAPVDTRSCKHLKELLGFRYEEARVAQGKAKLNPKQDADGDADVEMSPPPEDKKGKRKRMERAITISDDESDADTKSPSKRQKRDGGKSDSDASTKSAPANMPVSVLLAQTWKEDKGVDPTGYWISEKLDGVRAYFCNNAFYSRLGNKFFAPDSFSKDWRSKLPKGATLDGELFTGRNKFQDTVSIVRSGASQRWPEVKYYVFDAPFIGHKPFEARLAFLKSIFGPPDAPTYSNVVVVEQIKCTGKQHVLDRLEALQKKGAEGLMLREPNSQYVASRSSTLLKVKTFYDAEAKVIAHHKGSGKNSQVMGAIEVEMACGKTFKIGTGFSDAHRRKPPRIGSIVVYKFQELSKSGVPRFPVYVGDAIDKKVAKDADIRVVVDDDD